MPRKYQPGLESTKSWLKSHGKGEIEEVLEEVRPEHSKSQDDFEKIL